ncbi:hypothetical protein NT6N_10400 [Oceaniferula spumae]|uniref:Uncharacterized protein n=1 Tax=Oceaniferula spumae TaxID=2979115 RepID=A0AAT9FJ92_9BACT
MSSHHHKHHSAVGRVDGPALLYGAVGLMFAVAMHWVGLFKKGNTRILEALMDPVFRGGDPQILSTPVLATLTAVFCFGLAFAVLDSSRAWRRIILGVTVLVLVLAMVPTLAVWNIYFPPMMTIVGVFWTWFCTMMYVNHHLMPCDAIVSTPSQTVTAQPVTQPPSATPTQATPKPKEKPSTAAKAKKAAKKKNALKKSKKRKQAATKTAPQKNKAVKPDTNAGHDDDKYKPKDLLDGQS